MQNVNFEESISVLNEIVRYELVGVVKYTHFALMVTGPHRLILDKFLRTKLLNLYPMLNRQEKFLLDLVDTLLLLFLILKKLINTQLKIFF